MLSSQRATTRSLSCLLAAAALLLAAGDWPQWRGPQGTGATDEKRLLSTWSQTENVKWKVPLDGPGNSSPIVVGDKVFVTHSPANSTLRGLLCFDRATGQLLWKHQVDHAASEPTHGTNPLCAASPVSDGQRVIAWYGSAGIFCYDLQGQVLWQRILAKVEHIWGYGASPAIHDDLVILNYGPGLSAFVVALDKHSGSEVWRKEFPGQRSEKIDEFRGSWSTPLIHQIGQRTQLLLSLPETLRALDPKTGDELWSCGGLSKLVYTSPVVTGDVVVCMSGYGGPALAVPGTGRGDVTASRLWLHDKQNPQRVGSGVVVGDYLYLLNESGSAWCLDPKTGERKWEQRLGSGTSWSSLAFADGRLYAPNMAGTTFVLEPTPAQCKVLAENELGEMTRSSPAFSNGQIFLRTYEHLYCIEEQNKK